MWLGIFLHGHDAFASPGCLHQYAACSHLYSWTKIWYGVKVFVHGNNACAETPGLSIRITTFQAPNNHSQRHQRNEVMVRCFFCWSALLCKTLYPVGPPFLVQPDLKLYVLPLNGLTSLLTIVPIIRHEVSQWCGCPLCCSSWVDTLHSDNLMHLSPFPRKMTMKEKWLWKVLSCSELNYRDPYRHAIRELEEYTSPRKETPQIQR